VDSKDLLVFKSIESDGTGFVKIHNASSISVHGGLQLEGNVLINPKFQVQIKEVKSLSLQYYHLVSALVLKDHQTSGYIGFKRKDKSLDKVHRVLEQLLTKEE
jgi:hypothetical protein